MSILSKAQVNIGLTNAPSSYDFRNKKIGVIGNGSSAIQIIPKLQQVEGAELTCFMRSPTWISSAFGDNGMIELGLDPADTNCKRNTLPPFQQIKPPSQADLRTPST